MENDIRIQIVNDILNELKLNKRKKEQLCHLIYQIGSDDMNMIWEKKLKEHGIIKI